MGQPMLAHRARRPFLRTCITAHPGPSGGVGAFIHATGAEPRMPPARSQGCALMHVPARPARPATRVGSAGRVAACARGAEDAQPATVTSRRRGWQMGQVGLNTDAAGGINHLVAFRLRSAGFPSGAKANFGWSSGGGR